MDTMFLMSKGIMDYSLLIKSEQYNPNSYTEVSRHCHISSDKREIYHIGIIDYLQKWNFAKKREQLAKRYFLKKTKNDLSAVEPIYYQKRFQKFMKDILNSEN